MRLYRSSVLELYNRTDAHRDGEVMAQPSRAEVEAVGIEQPGAHPIQTILERFRGQVSMRTRPKNTSKTHYRTFL